MKWLLSSNLNSQCLDSSNNIDSRINITTFFNFPRHASTVHPSSSVLHVLKSPLNLKRARSYKVRYIALSILRTKTKLNEWRLVLYRERVRLMCFTCWLRSGFFPFYTHGFLKLHLVLSVCRVQDLEAIRWAGCSTKLWTLQMFKNVRRPVWK